MVSFVSIRRSSPQPKVILSDSAPLPQQVVHKQEFIPVETNTFAAADAQAKAEYVRKYPGALTTIEAFSGMRDQFYNALKTR
jgi:hypothetical protein